jgi:hypothetical protein
MKSRVGQFEGGGALGEFMCVQVGESERMVGQAEVMARIGSAGITSGLRVIRE